MCVFSVCSVWGEFSERLPQLVCILLGLQLQVVVLGMRMLPVGVPVRMLSPQLINCLGRIRSEALLEKVHHRLDLEVSKPILGPVSCSLPADQDIAPNYRSGTMPACHAALHRGNNGLNPMEL